MGCFISRFPKEKEQHLVLRTSDSLTLLVKGSDRVRVVPLRKSLEVVVVNRRNNKGDVKPDPILFQDVNK